MRKAVSKDGYTLFFEKTGNEDIDCVAYETGKQMSVERIGELINLSRISVSKYLKKSLVKIYKKIRLNDKNISSVDVVCSMAVVFNLQTVEEYKRFISLFPNEIRSEINAEAKRAA